MAEQRREAGGDRDGPALSGGDPLAKLLWTFRREIGAQRGRLTLAGLLVISQVAAELILPWPLKVVVDNVIRGKPLTGPLAQALGPVAGQPYRLLAAMLCAIVLLAIANALLEYRGTSQLVRVGQALVLAIRQRVYAHLQRLSFAFHTRQPVGDLTARVTTDVNALQELFASGLRHLAANGLVLLGMLAVMLYVDWRFTFAALAVLPALGWLILRFKPRVKRATRAAKRKEREMASLAQETLVSYRVVQAFSAEDFEDQRFAAQGELAMAARVEAGVLQARFAPSVELTLALGTAAAVGLGAWRSLEGTLSVGTLLVFLSYLKSMYSPMKQLAKAGTQLANASVSAELVLELLEAEERPAERRDARPAPRFRGELGFDHVGFSYRPGAVALADVSLAIAPGQHCVIVGRTGAGKSTLVSLLPRFADPQAGAVLIDGLDVRSFTLRSLREQIAVVPQEAMLFRMSVQANIAYARPGASREQVLAAARAANAHEFIVQLAHSYDTVLDERGGNLSGGQRQRLTLARAFLRDAPILLLDEPTTGLDLASEALVLEALERLRRGRTTLTIAHRLATIERADLIAVLDAGRLVDSGTHAELVGRCRLYRDLYEKHSTAPEGAQAV
ncbi:MAG: ABC transporter ATP-binding protein [Deltaproteobacteria bacterium]|nr:ABC transporter ATP-binding protein [Deltaproteobacteria bacterium]